MTRGLFFHFDIRYFVFDVRWQSIAGKMLVRKARTPVLFYRKVRPGYLYALYVLVARELISELEIRELVIIGTERLGRRIGRRRRFSIPK